MEAIYESDIITLERKSTVKKLFLENYLENNFPPYYELTLDACLPDKEVFIKINKIEEKGILGDVNL